MLKSTLCVALTLAILLVSGTGNVVLAQTQNASAAPQNVVEALAQIQAALNQLQQSVNTIGATKNFLFTPMARLKSGVADCNVVNVIAIQRTVNIELINAATSAVVFSSTVPVDPGKARAIGIFSSAADFVFCKFTVVDGIDTDVRANLTLSPNISGDDTTTLSLDAK